MKQHRVEALQKTAVWGVKASRVVCSGCLLSSLPGLSLELWHYCANGRRAISGRMQTCGYTVCQIESVPNCRPSSDAQQFTLTQRTTIREVLEFSTMPLAGACLECRNGKTGVFQDCYESLFLLLSFYFPSVERGLFPLLKSQHEGRITEQIRIHFKVCTNNWDFMQTCRQAI